MEPCDGEMLIVSVFEIEISEVMMERLNFGG